MAFSPLSDWLEDQVSALWDAGVCNKAKKPKKVFRKSAGSAFCNEADDITNATGVPPSPAGPPGCSLLHLLQLSSLSFIIGMPNRSCILKLRTNQYFVCNFFCMPRCQCQIAPKKHRVQSKRRTNGRNAGSALF